MKCLLDNDVFFAAIYTGHARHASARHWLDSTKRNGWGIAAETYLAAIRLLMNPTIMGAGLLAADVAIRAVETELRGRFPGSVILSKTHPEPDLLANATGHRQIMDLWLLQIARDSGTKLATRDRGIVESWPDLTFEVP